ncbi:MAG: T9SS type A sorting domain-containing protein [Flavobacteriales bacterium]|nr:MAG: T9SS type A sorting domain-containing protein [Flavobacteriales bacterium]
MKKLLLTISLGAIGLWSYAQVQVKGISPASVQHTFEFGVQANETNWPESAGGSQTDDGSWSLALDFGQPGVYVQGELMLVEDGTPGLNPQGNPVSQEGCSPLINDLTGKIAVVYRNTCSFGTKVTYAQDAGAIAVVIVNREDALIGMLGDVNFPNCTIPAIALKSSAGAELVNEMQNGPVVLFIGNKIGVAANDMATAKPDLLLPSALTMPYDIALNGSEHSIEFGLFAYNLGANAQTGVTATVDVTYGGSSVYSQTSTPLDFVAPVGVVVDTQYFDLGVYSPSSWNVGTYSVTYTINGSDDDASDNVYSYDFHITNNEDNFGYATQDANGFPIASSYVSPDLSTSFSWMPCIVFRNSNLQARGAEALGMNLSAKAVGSTMANSFFEVRMYPWNDTLSDLSNGSPNYTSTYLNLSNPIGTATYFFSDESESGQNIYVPFDEAPISLLDNQRYLFCVYSESDSLRFGYNTSADYYTTVYGRDLQVLFPLADVATTGATPTWYSPGFGLDYIPAFSVRLSFPPTLGVENSNLNASSSPYPNPAVNMLNVPVRKGVKGAVTVEVLDLTGKVVLSENKTIGEGPLKINVASIANGAYLFNLTFADGSKDTFKVSVNR